MISTLSCHNLPNLNLEVVKQGQPINDMYIPNDFVSLYTIPGKAMHLSSLVNGCLVQPLWLHSLTRPVDSNILSVEKSWIYMRG